MSKNRVMHFEVQADNVERAISFYKRVFDWKISKAMNSDPKIEGSMNYWMIVTGEPEESGINGGLYERPKDNKIYTYDCTIVVPDIDKAIELIKENGGKILMEKNEMPETGIFAKAQDTEGNIFGLMQDSDTMKKE